MLAPFEQALKISDFYAYVALLPHDKREVITLDCCNISTAGEPGEIGSVCPRVTELDLTGNCIEHWNEVCYF